jgi:hypothetical protein
MPYDMSEATPATGTDPACPTCGQTFHRKRKNQTYCGRDCQKKKTQNSNRGSRKADDNQDARWLLELHRRRGFLLNDELYRKPPVQRPAFLECIIKAARDHDWHLRRLLRDRRALRDYSTDHAGRPNLARTLDHYCKLTRGGASVFKVVAKGWTDPDEIRPPRIYKDPDTDPDDGEGQPQYLHVVRDPAEFLATLRALRAEQTNKQPTTKARRKPAAGNPVPGNDGQDPGTRPS